MLKLFLLLYADDIVFLSESAEDLQKVFHILKGFMDKWNLIINTRKTKIAML